jgi:predicted lipoprotein with Yx(FWY)xxD motif
MPIIPAAMESGEVRQKQQNPILINNLGMVLHAYDPRDMGGIHKRIMV